MTEESLKDGRPRVAVNKAAWRAFAIGGLVVTLSLVAALVARDALADGPTSDSDPLTTLTLVLAVLAFLVQIFVFVFQSNASNSSVLRSEDLNAQTRGVLEKIEANSSATQRVLFAQFDRLLDYVVDGQPAGGKGRVRRLENAQLKGDADQTASEAGQPVSKADLSKAVDEAVSRATQRPSFPVGEAGPSEEDVKMLDYLRSWPDEEEGFRAVEILVRLSPLGLATLVRFGSAEVIYRLEGESVGLHVVKSDMDAATEELISLGLIRHFGGSELRLTDEGRAAWRILPFLKGPGRPDWVDDILKPLLIPIASREPEQDQA